MPVKVWLLIQLQMHTDFILYNFHAPASSWQDGNDKWVLIVLGTCLIHVQNKK